MRNKTEKAVISANQILSEAKLLGIDINSQTDKLQKAISSKNSDKVTIAMLGGFADGKTTIIAALQGQELEGMKIASDESSNEIIPYSTNFLGRQFKIVDTPGLFGYKKEDNQKLSDITTQYISEADVVVYVTEACNPLPESHQANLKKIMRDLGKLKAAIFVINKMDQTDCELDDEESFKEAEAIKTKNLKQRLERCLNLSSEESANLQIICIAANPNSKDLAFWFNKKPEKYKAISHIEDLRQSIVNSTATMDVAAIKQATTLSITKDAVLSIENIVRDMRKNANKAVMNARQAQQSMEEKLAMLKENLIQEQKALSSTMLELKKKYILKIQTASVESLEEVLTDLGVSADGYVDFSNLLQEIDGELLTCSTSSKSAVTRMSSEIEVEAAAQNAFFDAAAKKGIDWVGKQKISPEMVNKVRDMFFKNYKFKPWGKIKLAQNINKGLGYATVAADLAMELWSIYKNRETAKKLDNAKNELTATITKIFEDIYKLYGTPEDFYKNFGRDFYEVKKEVEERALQLKEISSHNEKVSTFLAKIDAWKDEFYDRIEDAEFEEIN